MKILIFSELKFSVPSFIEKSTLLIDKLGKGKILYSIKLILVN